MTKVMLVEDDNNLREIYAARLAAEGYQIVAAKDGEEALAMLVKEKPDVVLSDIMMPKISGFDMLDIIRSTPETKHTKVIMMTALSQKEDQERGQQLGADRYLVKSQVTLEDVVHVVADVLDDGNAPTPAPDAAAPTAAAPATTDPAAQPAPAAPTPAAVPEPTPAAEPAAPAAPPEPTPAPANLGTPDQPAPTPLTPPALQIEVQDPTQAPAEPPSQSALPAQPPAQPAPSAMPTGAPKSGDSLPEPRRQRIIQPISDPNEKTDINVLLEKEMANEAAASLTQTSESEEPQPTAPAPAPTPTPGPEQNLEQNTEPGPNPTAQATEDNKPASVNPTDIAL